MAGLTEILIPFPQRLMSAARAPSKMPIDFARDITNMYVRQDGAGIKRNGFVKQGQAIGAGNIMRLMHYIGASGEVQILAVTDDGKIHLQAEDGSWSQVYTGLDVSGIVRWVHFAGKLIICNGVDDLLAWNGTSWNVVSELVVDTGANLTYVSSTSFTIDSDASFYPVGSAVQAELLAGVFVNSTVASVAGTGTITVTLADSVLTSDLSEVSFTAKPPKFSFIYPAHDRLWGFGVGAVSNVGFGSNVDRTRVFYTYGLNDETAWYDDDGLTQSINLADKMPALDELTAMAVKDGLTVFFCKNYTQVWGGSDPTLTGDFSWVKTLPLGVVHGDLVVDLPNDVGFFTRFGARTLSRTLQTEQLDVGDFGSEMEPALAEAVGQMLANNDIYKQAQGFKCDKQGWFGFRAAGNPHIFQALAGAVGWTVFAGLFTDSTAFLNTPDGELYAAKAGQVYKYDETVWADDGVNITTRWWTPWLNVGNAFKRWANKFYEVITEQGSAIPITLKRYKNYDSSSYVETAVTANVAADYWEGADWDNALWDNGSPVPERERDRFVADVFSYALESDSANGPLTIFGFKIQGVRER